MRSSRKYSSNSFSFTKEIAIIVLLLYSAIQVSAGGYVPAIAIGIGFVVVIAIWGITLLSITPNLPKLGQISGREWVDVAIILYLVFILVGTVVNATSIGLTNSQYYGLMLGSLTGILLISVVVPLLRSTE